MKIRSTLCAFVCLLTMLFAPATHAQRTLFSLSEVRLLDSPFQQAQQTDIRYILSLDPDRLMAPLFREAGMEAKAKPYGNWESMGLDGHTVGHYLTALSQIVATTGNTEAASKLTYLLGEMKRCQDHTGTGFIGGTPGSLKLWENVAAGRFAGGNGLYGTWVPWYNLHKTFAGLRDTWLLTGNTQARTMFLKLSDWCRKTTSGLSDAQMQQMLREEYGGMNEVLADAAAISGDTSFLTVARRFSHQTLLKPLMQGQDKLTGMHANTQIPKVIGFERIGELSNDTAWEKAAEFFWKNVTENRSIAIGGNSVSEHFHPTDNFSSMVENREGPETCNTYNMLRLSRMLWLRTGDTRYLEFYERAMFNHILSSQHPDGGFVYFTPARPRHYRVYSEPQESFWCCVGTGLENHTKYGELIYAREGKDVLVNLYVPSELNWKAQGLKLTQLGDLSKGNTVSLTLSLKKSKNFALKLRQPAWTCGKPVQLSLNGKPVQATTDNEGLLVLNRTWKNGDCLELVLPMELRAEYLPDGSPWAAFTFGPWVLGAATETTDLTGIKGGGSRMGHVAAGKTYPIDQAPYFVVSDRDPNKLFTRKGDSIRFQISGSVQPSTFSNLVLRPFYQIHDSRYMLYWSLYTPEQYIALQEKLRQEEAEKQALDLRTVDKVAPGEQQPEKDHNMQQERSESGIYMDRHWRHTRSWLSYDLKTEPGPALKLMITYSGNDVNRTFTILMNGLPVKTVTLTGGKQGKFYTEEYELTPAHLAPKSDGLVTVRFEAAPKSIAGGFYDIRLVRP